MQGDIGLPQLPKKPKAEPTPKPKDSEPEPDISINEADLPSSDDKPDKQRKILIAPHKHFKRFWHWWTGLNRNVRFAIIAALLLVFGAGAVGWYYFIHPNSTPSIQISKTKPKAVKPTTVPAPLTGLQVAPALAKRPVTAVMIENSFEARPQSGLQDAGVVVEAIAEGGITRFVALFQVAQPQYIGPVRSLRPYFLDFAAPFHASIAHVGGSPTALSEVRDGQYRDIDQFFNSGYYWRISSRAAPHNVYTSFAKLDALNQKKGYTTSTFTSWPRKADKKLATPTAKTINFNISSSGYNVRYNYDAASNSYLRDEAGAPHLDLVSATDKTGVQLKPKVVIALVMSYGLAADHHHSVYGDTGSGTAYVFQDGGVTVGNWEKPSADAQISFKDASGNPIKLNAGQTWITLVGATNQVSYSP